MHILKLEGKGETNSGQLVRAGARMCRRCFSAYDRCTKQITLLRKSISRYNVMAQSQITAMPEILHFHHDLPSVLALPLASPDVMVGKRKLTTAKYSLFAFRCKYTAQLMPLGDDSTSHHHGFKPVGDNIDLTVSTRYMWFEQYRDQSLNYFHCYAVLDRINMDSLSLHLTPTCHPCPTHMALSLLPSQEHYTILRKTIATLISRVLVTHMNFFPISFF